MVKSRFGRILKAIAQADILAESIGIDVPMHKIIAFTIGGFFAGMAGSLSAHLFRVIAPLDFGINYMIMVIAFVVVGGAANIFGPVIGACFFSLLSLLLAKWGHVEVLITGLILILVMRFLPGGLLSFPSSLRRLKSRE
jgi:branched-chain amino acid transport system permease protein